MKAEASDGIGSRRTNAGTDKVRWFVIVPVTGIVPLRIVLLMHRLCPAISPIRRNGLMDCCGLMSTSNARAIEL
jgi:hypothetical protein